MDPRRARSRAHGRAPRPVGEQPPRGGRCRAATSPARLPERRRIGPGADRRPLGVVARRRLWYLLCWDHSAQAVRTYRVDRVLDVATLDERFDPPPDLDPVALVEQHLGSGRRYATRVRFDAPVAQVRPFVGPVMGRLEPVDDGTACLLTGTTDNPQMYAGEWLAAIPMPFRVLGDQDLATAVTEVAERLAQAVR